MLPSLDGALGNVAGEPALFVCDYRRVALAPYPGAGDVPHAADLAARAHATGGSLRDGDLLALPIAHRADPVGVLVLRLGSEADGDVVDALARDLAPLLGMAIASHAGVSDRLEQLRRTTDMALAAEIQWRLLPAATHRDRDILVSAALEPAYDTGGDVFDYARDGTLLRLAVLDAMGHGFHAAVLSVAVASALRLGRRDGLPLPDLAERMSAAIGAWTEETAFVTAVLVDLDLATGSLEWLTAGHVPPLRISSGEIEPLPHHPNLPLGVVLGSGPVPPDVHTGSLAPGETLVLYSDGVVDNLMGSGIGDLDQREAAFHAIVGQHVTDGPTPGVARHIVSDMLESMGPELRDDATLMVAHLAR